MLNFKKNKKLPEGYNYYNEVMKKTKVISKQIFKEKNNEILEQRLYNLIINLCNQTLYDCKYTFTSEDLFFIADYNINIYAVLKQFEEDIIKLKLSPK